MKESKPFKGLLLPYSQNQFHNENCRAEAGETAVERCVK